MNKISTILLFLLTITLGVKAQNVTGKIVDNDTKEAMLNVTVQLLKTDSTFVGGSVSDIDGNFTVKAPAAGQYLLKLTSVGYTPLVKNVKVEARKPLDLGTIQFKANTIMLKEAVVTGVASKVIVKEDTFVYNAAAYHTPEGSVVEELVKRLPGAQVDDDGKIKINGKEVKKIRVDGKEFMTGDTETALKNLPVAIIDRIKAYDEKSDLSRITGIDDGNDETVLDFGIKSGMNKGFMTNNDFGIGTESRYTGRTLLSYMKDDWRIIGMGRANNVADQGFGGGGGFGRGGNGLTANKMGSLQFNYEKKDLLKADGSIRWNHGDTDTWNKTASENFTGLNTSFNNNISQSDGRSNSWNGQMRFEWTPDTMTNIMFRPSFTFSKNDSRSRSIRATFNDDPYKYVEDPIVEETSIAEKLFKENIVVNTTVNNSLSYRENTSLNGMLQYNRKLGNKGRNITLRFDANYSEGKQYSTSVQDVLLALQDSTYMKNRYNSTPTKNYTYTGRITYSEPLAQALFLQFSYTFRYNRNKSDRATYNYDSDRISDAQQELMRKWKPIFRDWDSFLGNVGPNEPSDTYLDKNQSKFSQYDNYTQDIEVMLRKYTEKMNLSVGVMVQPQHSDFKYKYLSVDTIVKRNVMNFSPSLDFRYKFDKVTQLRAQYRGSSSQPSMTELLPITDDSDPMNISMGNPDLKPSFTQRFNLNFNTYLQSHFQSIMAFGNFSTTSNSIANAVQYDATTGSRTTRPENINGNWNVSAGFMYSASIDSAGVWNVNTFTNYSFNNHVSYLFQGNENQKNTTHNTTVFERLSLSYRSEWLEIEPNAMINYSKMTNMLQSNSNSETWGFNYGLNINVNTPWGTGFSTDARMSSRRGYSDASLNTNEFIWNAQISQSFLRGRPLTIMLQFYDILKKQSNFSRTINAMGRTDTENNNLNSYAMLHIVFRFNSFGGKAAQGPQGPANFRPGDFPRGGQGGGQGGFGGGRPGGGGGFGGGGFGGGGFRGPR